MVVGSVWFVLFWAAVIYVVYHVSTRGSEGGQARETPLDILRRRYAAGEISKEEFDRMRADVG
jgi:putative membrane protein